MSVTLAVGQSPAAASSVAALSLVCDPGASASVALSACCSPSSPCTNLVTSAAKIFWAVFGTYEASPMSR